MGFILRLRQAHVVGADGLQTSFNVEQTTRLLCMVHGAMYEHCIVAAARPDKRLKPALRMMW